MNLAQENFDRAVASGRPTLRQLLDHEQGARVDLSQIGERQLRTLVWDLESIQTAIRIEQLNRES